MEYLTTQEVAQKLRVHQNTILRWLNDGTLKGVKFGKLWRVPLENLSPGGQSGEKRQSGEGTAGPDRLG